MTKARSRDRRQPRSTAAQWAALADYGDAIGVAFQVVDDILDVTQASDKLGKTAGKDQEQDKPTYVSVLGLEAARAEAKRLHAQALDALRRSGLPDREHLKLLADMVVDREH